VDHSQEAAYPLTLKKLSAKRKRQILSKLFQTYTSAASWHTPCIRVTRLIELGKFKCCIKWRC